VNPNPEKIVDAAEQFIWLNARLVDRFRFDTLFRGGDPDRIVAALRPYQNPDGGFGNALECDFRGPISQTTPCDSAFRILDDAGRIELDLILPACDFLLSVTTEEGAVPMVLPSVVDYPRAPWWEHPTPAALLPTTSILGFLHKHRIEHPWIGPASDFCWRAFDKVPQRIADGDALQVAYDIHTGLPFLDYVPDRDRAERVAEQLGHILLENNVIAFDRHAPGDKALPLDFAPTPDTLGRKWFDDATISAHLDDLYDEQAEDGGFTVPWDIWDAITGPEWRGWQTVERLKTLRDYGRL
jgi:hypothetical protein